MNEVPAGTDRRRFLKFATAVGGTLAAVLAGIPGLRAFLSPAFQRLSGERWVRLGDPSTFEFGVPVKVEFVDTERDAWVETRVLRNVWLYTEDGETFRIYSGRCTHLGCSYGFDSDLGLFVCPCHEGRFDVKTGAVLAGPPPRPLDQLTTKVDEDGYLYVDFRNFRLGVPDKAPV